MGNTENPLDLRSKREAFCLHTWKESAGKRNG